MNRTIGFIGLGNMGYGMASNLLRRKFDVLAYDIEKEKLQRIVKKGALEAKSINEIAELVNIVVLCLPHPKISQEVIQQLISHNKKVKVVIETSTLTPEDTKSLSNILSVHGIDYLCAPMLGGRQAALDAKIHILVEGNKKVFEKYKKVFKAMGSRVDYMGQPPHATLAKLAYNICRYGNIAIAVDVLRFLKPYGTDNTSIYKLLSDGSLDNFGQVWKEDMKEMAIEGKEYTPTHIPEKDLSLIIQILSKQKRNKKFLKSIKEVYESLKKQSTT